MQSPGILHDYRGLVVLRGHLLNEFNSNQNKVLFHQSILKLTGNTVPVNIYSVAAKCRTESGTNAAVVVRLRTIERRLQRAGRHFGTQHASE